MEAELQKAGRSRLSFVSLTPLDIFKKTFGQSPFVFLANKNIMFFILGFKYLFWSPQTVTKTGI